MPAKRSYTENDRSLEGEDITKIITGDCLEVMRTMADNSIDCIVTDPPYGLHFMGKDWDHGIPGQHFWQEAIRICKPGAHLLAFGGTRTYHRLACAIEDAGWQIRDCLCWLYGSGFPKSLNIGKALDKCGGNSLWWFPEFIKNEREKRNLSRKQFEDLLKPAFPETKDLNRFIIHWEENTQRPSNEKFNSICKILELPFESIEEAEREVIKEIKQRANSSSSLIKMNCSNGETEKITIPSSELAKTFDGYGTALKPAYEPIIMAMKPCEGTYAQNAEKWGLAGINIDGCRIEGNVPSTTQGQSAGRWPANLLLDEEAAKMLDEQSGNLKSGSGDKHTKNKSSNIYQDGIKAISGLRNYEADSGGASRFFYCAKASSSERGDDNNHPTVKPLSHAIPNQTRYASKSRCCPSRSLCRLWHNNTRSKTARTQCHRHRNI